MESVVELALEAPFELRIIKIASVQVEIVSMHGNALVFELDDDLHAVAFSACRKGQEGMFVKTKLRENALEARITGFRHSKDCNGRRM